MESSDAKAAPSQDLDSYGNLGRRTTAHADADDSAAAIQAALVRLGITQIPDVALVPRNLETAADAQHLIYERESLDLRVLARQAELNLEPIAGSVIETIHENDATIILPALIFLGTLFEHADKVLSILKFLKSVADFVKSEKHQRDGEIEISQDLFINEGTHFETFSFKGPPSALPGAVESIKELRKGRKRS